MKHWRTLPSLLLVVALLMAQPAAPPVRADEPAPIVFVVGGVAGATLRAEPSGAAAAVANVPPGSLVTQAGGEVLANGVRWQQVRTAEGAVGYLPAGFLVAMTTEPALAAAPSDGTPTTEPVAIVSPAASGAVQPGEAMQADQPTAEDASTLATQVSQPGVSGQMTQGQAEPQTQGRRRSSQGQVLGQSASVSPYGAAPAGSVGSVPAPSAPAQQMAANQPATEPVVASNPSVTRSSATSANAPATVTPDARTAPASEPVVLQVGPTPTSPPVPARVPPRTTVEQRRGQDVRVAQIDEETAPDGRRMGAGRIVVGFKPGVAQASRLAAHRAAGTLATEIAGLPDVSVAEVTPGTVGDALAALRSRPDVAFAEPDYVRHVALTPNDPQYPSQYGPQKIGAPIAWDVTTGQATTKIAILDCGIFSESSTFRAPDGQTGHPDLRGKVVNEANFSNATTGTDDWCGHGTLMAGIAGANTNSAVGVAGVGFNVKLMNGKVLNDNGDGFDSWVATGIVWAADNGAKVISMSLGGEGVCSTTLQLAVDYAWNKGAVIVAAAGNGGSDGVGDPAPESPGSCNHVLPIGAIDQNDARAGFSNFGLAVPLAAPGVGILSTNFIGTYGNVSGTSPATPHVAAVAGLLWSTAYGSSNQSVVSRLLTTADPIAGTGTTWANGRVNAAAAIGPASCAPRPQVLVTTSVSGPPSVALQVTVKVSGAGNAIRFVQVGPTTGTTQNATVTFPGTQSVLQGTTSYVPTNVSTQATFQVQRPAPGQPSLLSFTVTDGCGVWRTFAGGGTGAGF